jgi:hypothetical protein
MRVELALALGWTVDQVAQLDDAELATVLDVLQAQRA